MHCKFLQAEIEVGLSNVSITLSTLLVSCCSIHYECTGLVSNIMNYIYILFSIFHVSEAVWLFFYNDRNFSFCDSN